MLIRVTGPGLYNPRVVRRTGNMIVVHSQRFNDKTEMTPGPSTYEVYMRFGDLI